MSCQQTQRPHLCSVHPEIRTCCSCDSANSCPNTPPGMTGVCGTKAVAVAATAKTCMYVYICVYVIVCIDTSRWRERIDRALFCGTKPPQAGRAFCALLFSAFAMKAGIYHHIEPKQRRAILAQQLRRFRCSEGRYIGVSTIGLSSKGQTVLALLRIRDRVAQKMRTLVITKPAPAPFSKARPR